jgi:hypothetical protein
MSLYCCALFFALCVCVCCCCIVLLCVYSTPSIFLILIVISCVRHERFQLVEIPDNRDIVRYKEEPVLKFDLWITSEVLSATLVYWEIITWSRQAYYA